MINLGMKTMVKKEIQVCGLTIIALGLFFLASANGQAPDSTNQILERVRGHDFKKNSGYAGVGDLTDDAWQVRILAIRDLVRLGSEAVPAIIASLQDENRHVRHVCVTVLGILGVHEAGDDLLSLLTKDPDPIVRGQTAQALGQIGDVSAAESLIISLDDESWEVRAQAAKALGRLGDKQTLGKLKQALSDENWWVRHNAANSLHQLGEEGIATLREASYSGEETPRAVAAQVLAERALGV